jgi:hypothetical protein
LIDDAHQSATDADAGSGDPYCGQCGYSLKGLEDSSRCPECGRPIVEVLMRRGFVGRTGKRYRSKAQLFGLPVVDVAIGPLGQELRGRARGTIAIGDVATGWLAVGGVARGIVAVGGVAIGLFSFGGLAVGLLTATGGLAICFGLAYGGFAIASLAFGGLAIGVIAQGGLAVGLFARGAAGIGRAFPGSFDRWRWLVGGFPPMVADTYRQLFNSLVPGLLAAAFIGVTAMLAVWRAGVKNSERAQ